MQSIDTQQSFRNNTLQAQPTPNSEKIVIRSKNYMIQELKHPCKRFYISDHVGNRRVLFSDLNDDGRIQPSEILGNYNSYPFGLRWDGGITDYTDRFRYVTKGYEQQTGLGLNYRRSQYRFLDPSIGRFLSVDPEADAPNLVGWSPYHYSYNNPINYVDPDGRNPIRAAIAAAKIGKRAYKAYRKAKKAGRNLTSKDLKRIGLDEIADIADDLTTVFGGEGSVLERVTAAGDLILGTDLNNKNTSCQESKECQKVASTESI